MFQLFKADWDQDSKCFVRVSFSASSLHDLPVLKPSEQEREEPPEESPEETEEERAMAAQSTGAGERVHTDVSHVPIQNDCH